MTGYLKIRTKVDNSGIDKDIIELESKIKKLQTDNVSLGEDSASLQEEINQYTNLCEKAEEYKEKLKHLSEEKEAMLKTGSEPNLMNNAEYTSIQNKIKEIRAEYLQAIEDIEAKYANVNWNKNNKKNQNRAIMRQAELEQANQTYLPQMKQLVNQRESITVSAPDTSRIDLQIEQMKQKYAQATAEIDKQAPKLDKVEARLSKIKGKQSENNSRIQEFKDKIDAIRVGKVEGQLSNIGKAIQNQIGKIGKMAMGVIGVRTAYNGVRSAISMVSQYNSQVSTDLEYMKYCISNALAPVIQKLVQLLYTVLSYVNAISSAWFGINLFSNSSTKNFQKMQSSTNSTAKSAKEIQKSLQGFDEMNVLPDSSSANSGATEIDTPSMDLSGIQGEIPKWLQWIIDNKDIIIGALAGIAGGILAVKLGAEGILGLGIGIIIAGVVTTIQAIVDFIKDPSWENFSKILEGLTIILVGVAVAMLAVNAANPATWIILAIALITALAALIIEKWDAIKAVLATVGEWIYNNIILPVWDFLKKFWSLFCSGLKFAISIVSGIFTALVNILIAPFQTMWDTVKGVFNGIKNIIQGVFKVIKGIFTGDMKTVFEGFKQIFKGVFDSLWSIAKAPLNLIIRGINALIKGANKISFDIPDWVPGIGGKTFGIKIKEIPLLAKGGVVAKPTTAVIGEAGREAVVPLENNLEWLDILADKLASKIGANGGSYVIQMDGRTIQRGLAKRKQELAFATNGR